MRDIGIDFAGFSLRLEQIFYSGTAHPALFTPNQAAGLISYLLSSTRS